MHARGATGGKGVLFRQGTHPQWKSTKRLKSMRRPQHVYHGGQLVRIQPAANAPQKSEKEYFDLAVPAAISE